MNAARETRKTEIYSLTFDIFALEFVSNKSDRRQRNFTERKNAKMGEKTEPKNAQVAVTISIFRCIHIRDTRIKTK